MKTKANIHGVGAVVLIAALWLFWCVSLDSDLRLGWFFVIASVCYGSIMIISGVRTSGLTAPDEQRENLMRNAVSIGGHLFILFVIFFAGRHLRTVARSVAALKEETTVLPIAAAKALVTTDHLIFSIVAALAIGAMIPFMVLLREEPLSIQPRERDSDNE